MEALFEILFEIFGEIILNIFFEAIAFLCSLIFSDLDNNPSKRRIIKIIVYTICFTACVILLVLSFIYSKTAYAILATTFLSINLFIFVLKLINITFPGGYKQLSFFIIILLRITRITFYVLVFVFLNTLNTTAAKATIITISSVLMLIFMCIDIYKLKKYLKKKKQLDYQE